MKCLSTPKLCETAIQFSDLIAHSQISLVTSLHFCDLDPIFLTADTVVMLSTFRSINSLVTSEHKLYRVNKAPFSSRTFMFCDSVSFAVH